MIRLCYQCLKVCFKSISIFFVIILKMEPKKDFSTAILDAKKAPNKLIVISLSYLTG